MLRATQTFWAVRSWISDGGPSHVILCKCSLCCPFSSALPSTVLLSCSFPFPPLPGNDGWIYTDTCTSCLCTVFSSYHCVSQFPSGSEVKSISEIQTKLCQHLFSSWKANRLVLWIWPLWSLNIHSSSLAVKLNLWYGFYYSIIHELLMIKSDVLKEVVVSIKIVLY